jgi:hypothetical protein
MESLFDHRWEELSLDSIERFFSTAGDEGLTWEAKGTEMPRPDSIRKSVAGFANQIGGYLVIGARRDLAMAQWVVEGVPYGSGLLDRAEPSTWVSSLIAPAGITPTPPFDVRHFWTENRKVVLVIRVEPVSTPPCMTMSGVVFQRVVGATAPVQDPLVLTELIKRGATARLRTADASLGAARRLLEGSSVFPAELTVFSVSLCPTDIGSSPHEALFVAERATRFERLVSHEFQSDRMLRYRVGFEVRQDCIRAWTASREIGAGATAAVFWDGAAAASFAIEDDDFSVSELTELAGRYWRGLQAALALFGWSGDAHLTVAFNSAKVRGFHKRGPTPTTEVRRWVGAGPRTEAELASVMREIQRAFGYQSWEPVLKPEAQG